MFETPKGSPIIFWNAVIEPDFGQERFLTDDPKKLYTEGHMARIPVMSGITEYEFLGPAIGMIDRQYYNDILIEYE